MIVVLPSGLFVSVISTVGAGSFPFGIPTWCGATAFASQQEQSPHKEPMMDLSGVEQTAINIADIKKNLGNELHNG